MIRIEWRKWKVMSVYITSPFSMSMSTSDVPTAKWLYLGKGRWLGPSALTIEYRVRICSWYHTSTESRQMPSGMRKRFRWAFPHPILWCSIMFHPWPSTLLYVDNIYKIPFPISPKILCAYYWLYLHRHEICIHDLDSIQSELNLILFSSHHIPVNPAILKFLIHETFLL